VGDRAFRAFNGLHLSMDSIINGTVDAPMFDNPFKRFHQSLVDYGHEHDNMDDIRLYETTAYERLKPVMPKDASVVGTTSIIPT